MTNSGGGGAVVQLGAVGETGSVFLDDSDGYTIDLVAATPKEITEANSVLAAVPLNAGPVGGSVVANGSAGSIIINKIGKYEVSLSASFSSSGGAKVDGAAYLNGVRLGEVAFERDIANPNDVGSAGPSSVIEILQGDLPAVITTRWISSVTRTISIEHMSLHVVGSGL